MEVKNTEAQVEEQAVVEAIPETEAHGSEKKKQKRKKNARKKPVRRIVIITVIVAVLVFAVWRFLSAGSRPAAIDPKTVYTYAAAERRDISSTLTGSGTLTPISSYTVMTLVSGEILSAPFEEGDTVNKGDTLYTIDSSDASTSIERAKSSLEQSQKNYDKKLDSRADLTITAPISGVITNITPAVGDTVGTQGAIATIEDISTLKLTEFYSTEYKEQIYIGMPATVSVGGQMLNLSGTVTEISSLTRISETGVSCFAVTVSVQNPGSLAAGSSATCCLADTIYPTISDDDGLDANNSKTVTAKISGEVAFVYARNYEQVTAGQTLFVLTSDTLDDEIESAYNSLRDAQLSLQSQSDTLDNYTITAPIDGTIIEKYYKQGENSDSGKTLCTIYDLSALSLTMNVDELDISTVSVGQRAEVTTDSAEGRVYEGIVTRVGVNGTTSGGVTTYPVTIRVDKTDGLLPGMNVDIMIMVEEANGVIAIPSAAVERGGRVLVKTKDGTTGEGSPVDGYGYVMVQTGISDENFIEIIAGLEPGDEIAYIDDFVISDGMPDFGSFTMRTEVAGEGPQMQQGGNGNAVYVERPAGGY